MFTVFVFSKWGRFSDLSRFVWRTQLHYVLPLLLPHHNEYLIQVQSWRSSVCSARLGSDRFSVCCNGWHAAYQIRLYVSIADMVFSSVLFCGFFFGCLFSCLFPIPHKLILNASLALSSGHAASLFNKRSQVWTGRHRNRPAKSSDIPISVW